MLSKLQQWYKYNHSMLLFALVINNMFFILNRNIKRVCIGALSVLLLSGCDTLKSIDRGLYDAAEVVSETDRITGRRSLGLAGRAQQIKQGNQVIAQLLAQEKKAGRAVNAALDQAAYQRLVRVFDRVHQVSHLRDERWIPLLIDRPSFNAFTTGGTYIVVHSQLLRELTSDDELAAVLGHEIAHTVANHVFERQAHQMAALISGSRSAQREGYQAAYTHASEIEADQVGILYSALAGFDPYAASRIWERQYRKSGNARGLFFHDHPVNAERAAQTRRVADQVRRYYSPGQRNPNAASLLHTNTLWQQRQGARPGEGGGLAAVMGAALGAYTQHEKTKHEANRQARQMQQLRALGANIRVLEQRPVDGNRWQVMWQNANSHALDKVVMGVIVGDTSGKTQRYVAHINGPVRAGQRFVGTFQVPFPVSQLPRLQLRYYLDDADLLR